MTHQLELGISLPNYGPSVSVDEMFRSAEAAEQLGYDAIWATEHVIVGQEENADPYEEVLHPFNSLAWLAGQLDRVLLGTSITVLPLHNPYFVAKQATTLQLLSGGRFRLGIGVGWHEPEYTYMGEGFSDRGARADEELRLIKALWAGDDSFHGDYWSYEDARFGPFPDPLPEVWIGGNSARARRRAAEFGSVWHPVSPRYDVVADSKREFPDTRVIPRVRVRLGKNEGSGLSGEPDEIVEQAQDYISSGVDGFMLEFVSEGDITRDMKVFAEQVVPRLGE